MRKGRRRDDAVLYVHPRTKTGKLGYRDSSQKIISSRRVGATRMRCKPLYTPSFSSSTAGKRKHSFCQILWKILKSNQAWKKRKGRSSRKRNTPRERIKGRRCPLQDIGSQESPEEIIETPDSVLHGRFKEPEETLPRLGPLQRNRLSLGSEEEIPAYEEPKR